MPAFTAADLALLARLAGQMIPASAEYAVPGADDAVIQADIIRTLTARADAVQPMLARLGGADLAAAPDADVAATLAARLPTEPALGEVLAATLACYYRDDRVLGSLGMPPRPPYPAGHEIPEGDWSLLDPVRTRPKLWRDAPA